MNIHYPKQLIRISTKALNLKPVRTTISVNFKSSQVGILKFMDTTKKKVKNRSQGGSEICEMAERCCHPAEAARTQVEVVVGGKGDESATDGSQVVSATQAL